jgi:selenocysteine lyase/cysteine desulfurase
MKDAERKIGWSRYRSEFPAAKRYIYFNHAAVSPLSKRVVEAMNAVANGFLERGVLCEEEMFARVEAARGAAARLIGARNDEIAFIKNTTQGVLLAANGIRWKRGDNVVMPAIEFPANVYPWLALEKRGVRIVLVQPRDGRVTAEMLAGACTARTRCVTASFVQFSNGYRVDVATLGRFCRARGIYFHVDGIQSLGMLRCDVRAMKIDFLSAGGHKWLLGPAGTGFFYCRRDLLDELDIWNPGWLGVRNAWSFFDHDPTPRSGARLDRALSRDRHDARGEENPRSHGHARERRAVARLPDHEPPRRRRALRDSLLPPPRHGCGQAPEKALRRARRRKPPHGRDQARPAFLQYRRRGRSSARPSVRAI